jgi:hypothetical protein
MTLPWRKSRLRLLLITLGLLSIAGCATIPSSSCGVLFIYTPEFTKQAAEELDYLVNTGSSPAIVQMIRDYGVTRDTIRACK